MQTVCAPMQVEKALGEAMESWVTFDAFKLADLTQVGDAVRPHAACGSDHLSTCRHFRMAMSAALTL
jgi:hypothetical protein